jgi:type II secretory pathway predicted ATPase ExeA
MEYVRGESAEALVAREGRLRPERATDVLVQVASALHATHSAQVVHRDVKPANLLVGEGTIAKLGDFGMARSLSPGESKGQGRVGTPYYTAPELWQGEQAGPAADLYALGASYFHLLTGRPPYPQREVAEVERAHLGDPIPDPRELVPGLPESCALLVKRALAKRPGGRHASAQQLLWEARRVLLQLEELGAAQRFTVYTRMGERTPARPGRPVGVWSPPPAQADELLVRRFGFTDRPFAGVEDPADAPYTGEPQRGARRQLRSLLQAGRPLLCLTGTEGSGRSTLLRSLAAELGAGRLVVTLDARRSAGGRTLLTRLCSVVDEESEPGLGADQDQALGALLSRLQQAQSGQGLDGGPPLLVLDGLPLRPGPEVAELCGAALWSRGFQLLLVGPPGLGASLAAATAAEPGGEEIPEVLLPPLAPDQLAAYFAAWVQACRRPGAPALLLSRDALLLLHQRSQGVLERVDLIAENMLLLAAAEDRRVVSSWHAFAASDRQRWADRPPGEGLPVRPAAWPTAEALELLDRCRQAAGQQPWPRGGPPRTTTGETGAHEE